jgi:hypothetical protein
MGMSLLLENLKTSIKCLKVVAMKFAELECNVVTLVRTLAISLKSLQQIQLVMSISNATSLA